MFDKTDNPHEKKMNDILLLVINNPKIFKKNMSALAGMMVIYSNIIYGSRLESDKTKQCWTNPKDPILSLNGKIPNAYLDLIYQAWSFSVAIEDQLELKILNSNFAKKKKKTLEDYISYYLSKSCPFHEAFKGPKDVASYVLTNSSLQWNQGHVADYTENEINYSDLLDYETAIKKLPKPILEQLNYILSPEIKNCIKNAKTQNAKQFKLIEKEKKMMRNFIAEYGDEKVKKERDTYSEISERYSKIMTMPKNAHKSYVDGATKMCFEILANENESKNNKIMAQKFLIKGKGKI
jgi:hypothetical protein